VPEPAPPSTSARQGVSGDGGPVSRQGSAVSRGGTSDAAPGFGERLARHVAERESQIVLGLDPDPGGLWPGMERHGQALPDDATAAARAAAAVCAHCEALIDAAGPACVAVKPQLARFEQLGAAGREALGAVCEHARAAGLLVIADAKRGDIDVTAAAYARSLYGGIDTPFGAIAGLGVDMATVNPLMGSDALAPFVAAARESGAAVLVLVRTSNPGAADVEDLRLADAPTGTGTPMGEGGEYVWERIAMLVERLGREAVGESGFSDVGAVVGATVPEHMARARELMPGAVFLLPGVGAQGGRVEDLAPAFAPGRAGGLVSASRSIASAHLASGGDPAGAARAEAERLRAVAWSISG
jgi:orotidine-5'-phosphate decarboxylase